MCRHNHIKALSFQVVLTPTGFSFGNSRWGVLKMNFMCSKTFLLHMKWYYQSFKPLTEVGDFSWGEDNLNRRCLTKDETLHNAVDSRELTVSQLPGGSHTIPVCVME